jgi:hypothetical protein
LREPSVEEVRDVIVPRHLGRPGPRFVAEHAERGRLSGFAYGYTGASGQWWHDLVAGLIDEAPARGVSS